MRAVRLAARPAPSGPLRLFRAALALLVAALLLQAVPATRAMTLFLLPVGVMSVLTRQSLRAEVPHLRRVITLLHVLTGVVIVVTGVTAGQAGAWVAGPLGAALLLLVERRPALPEPARPGATRAVR